MRNYLIPIFFVSATAIAGNSGSIKGSTTQEVSLRGVQRVDTQLSGSGGWVSVALSGGVIGGGGAGYAEGQGSGIGGGSIAMESGSMGGGGLGRALYALVAGGSMGGTPPPEFSNCR
jgi:hypothetical protein